MNRDIQRHGKVAKFKVAELIPRQDSMSPLLENCAMQVMNTNEALGEV